MILNALAAADVLAMPHREHAPIVRGDICGGVFIDDRNALERSNGVRVKNLFRISLNQDGAVCTRRDWHLTITICLSARTGDRHFETNETA